MALEWGVDVYLGSNLLDEWVSAPRRPSSGETIWDATNSLYGTASITQTAINQLWEWTEGGDALGRAVKVTAAVTSSSTIGAVSPVVTLPAAAASANLMASEADVSFEDGTVGGWYAVSSSCTVTNSSTYASHGDYSLRGESLIAGQSQVIHGAAPVSEGQDYTAVWDLRVPAGRTAYARVRFFIGGAGNGSAVAASPIDGAPSGWQRYAVTVTPVAGSDNLRIITGINDAQVGDLFYVDRAGIWVDDGGTDWEAHSRPVTGAAWVRNDASYSGRSARVALQWLDGDGVLAGTSSGKSDALTGTDYGQPAVYAAMPPAGAVAFQFVVEFLGSHTAGDAYWAWSFEVCEGEQGITWADLSDYVEWQHPLTIVRGRTDTQDTVQPGRLTGVVLDNTDGRFTAGRTDGPYGRRFGLGTPVFVWARETSAAAYWECQFAGRIDALPLRWTDNGSRSVVTLSASDILADWVRADWSRGESYLAWAYRTGAAYSSQPVLAHWELTDVTPDGAVSTDGAYTLARESLAPAESAGSAHPTDGQPSLRFEAEGSGRLVGAVPAGSLTGWWLSAWVRMPGSASTAYADERFLPILVTGSSGEAVAIHPCSDGRLAATWVDSGGTATDQTYTYGPWGEGLADGQWHLVTVAGSVNGANEVLGIGIDGATTQASSATLGYALGGAPVSIAVGPSPTSGGVADEFEIAHVMFGETSHVGPVNGLQTYQMEEQRGLPAGEQLSRAARYGRIPYPGALWAPAGTTADCGPIPLTLTPIEAVRRIEATNYPGGVLYANRYGGLLYHPAADVYATTVRMTLAAEDVDAMTVAVDRAGLVNRATVTNVGRSDPRLADAALLQTEVRVEYEVSDEASISGQRAVESVELTRYEERGVTDARARYGVLARTAARLLRPDPRPRVPEISLDARTLPTAALRLDVLKLDLFDWLDVTTPDGDRLLLRVEGLTISSGARSWGVAMACSRAGFRLNDSTFGLLDGSTQLCQ